jgi:uncharacterized protein with HEPN domain
MAEDLMDKVFSFFSGDANATDDKTNMLKQIFKDLSQNKYAKFFRAKTEEADPSLASFLFTVYKMTYPIKIFMQDPGKMAKLKQAIIETAMDSAILDTVKNLDPALIQSRAKTMPSQELIAQIQADMTKLSSEFDSSKAGGADRYYNMVNALSQLVNFNYPAFFKKFDSGFIEGVFEGEPKFPAIKAGYILKELGEFLSVSKAMKPEADWNNVLNLFTACGGQELIQPDLFIMLVSNLNDIHITKVFEQIVQYCLRNPVWQWKARIPDEHIGRDWLESKRNEAQDCIDAINNAHKNTQIRALTKEIFDSSDLMRLENYVPAKGAIYAEKDLETFLYAEGLNYLKAFLEDYLEKEIRELCDILLIRGQWVNNDMSKEMSEALHQLLESAAPIAELDQTMTEDGSDGSRLKAAMLRVDRDRTQARYINSIIGSNNEEALAMINAAAQNFIIIGKHLKVLIEDVQKKHPELFLNWRELAMASKEPLTQRMIGDYKKINYFIQLMRLCTR